MENRLGRALGFPLRPRRSAGAEEHSRDSGTGNTRVLEALSRLAGGVAHDFNNILLVVQGYAELALAEENAGPEVRGLLSEVMESTTRAARLVQDLMVIGQRGPFSPRLLDLDEAILHHLPAMRAACGEGVSILHTPATGLPFVFADEDLLGRLLTALCSRAREAMPGGGTLSLRAALVDDPSGAGRVLLRATDTGEPIPEELRGRFFEPYLPGRSGGKGQGLGPLIAYAVAQRLGGEIRVESPAGAGTTVVFSLPARSAPAVRPLPEKHAARELDQPVPSPAPGPASAPSGGATLLLAEDDEGLRALAAKILSREGYTVLAARDGQEAVEIFEREGHRIQLVLLDDVMPRMGGRAALERIRRITPDLPAILCSGYTWRLDGQARERDGFYEILQKPWQPRELLHRVRECLRTG
jgi:CheY-like chemotaxis protein